ncbi:Stress response protein nst1 [Apophysomyces sp. BC1021]|nr:Stress response protein nst1 [Apophysomyces sp. BC1021]
MSNTEERQRIREFWLQLGEDERRSLVKVEKEAVLRKMKEQQKHSCNCSVCGKKRTAIEDELEVLYDAYYEELEQYANHQQQTRLCGGSNTLYGAYSASDALYEGDFEDTDHLDDDEADQEEDDEDEDNEEEFDAVYDDDDDDAVSRSDHSDIPSDAGRSSYGDIAHYATSDLARHTQISRTASISNGEQFNFGNSLTVKGMALSLKICSRSNNRMHIVLGGILTVADDLLKNDGKKFLDMMERLAERRMQKEEEVNLEQGEDYYDDDDEDDEAYEEEEDEDARTEEQRMEEGRKMFQIFAARMFEQRVLAAYREKVSRERQQRLIQELEEEDRLRQERELKKQKDKERKKDKKRQIKQEKEKERLAKEAQRQAEEAAARTERERKLEEERQKREQERLKKEEERRQKEEQRLRKEEEKRKRLKEERERNAEKERKRKEKEQQERREREEKERQQREEQERKKQEEKMKVEKQNAVRRQQEERQKLEGLSKPALPTAAAATTETVNVVDSVPDASSSVGTIAGTHSPPSDEMRQRMLMDALIGSSRSPNTGMFGEGRIVSTDMHTLRSAGTAARPAHVLLPPNGFPNLDILHGMPATPLMSPGNDLGNIRPDRENMNPASPSNNVSLGVGMGVLPIGCNLASSVLETNSSAKMITRPPVHIAPIGQPVNGRRASSVTGPIGSPVGSGTHRASMENAAIAAAEDIRPSAIKRPSAPGESDPGHSFFSNFLFGEPNRDPRPLPMLQPEQDVRIRGRIDNPLDRRYSIENAGFNWTNGWTASTALSNDVHGRLFGDVLADRSTLILERAKAAYLKLDEITQTKYFVGPPQFHTLVQLHRMMSDMYYDNPVDIRELYELIVSPLSGFQCINHAAHGCIVRFEAGMSFSVLEDPTHRASLPRNSVLSPPFTPHPIPSSSQPPQTTAPLPPAPLPLPLASATNPLQQQLKGNAPLFGGMS